MCCADQAPGILTLIPRLQGNNLTIDCANSNYSYLTSVCPNGNQTTNTSQVPLQPAAAPQASPVQGSFQF